MKNKRSSEFSSLLRTLFAAKKRLTLRALASKSGVSPAFISQILDGKRLPSDASILAIGEALNLSEHQLTKLLAAAQSDRLSTSARGDQLPTTSKVATHLPTDFRTDVGSALEDSNYDLWKEFFSSYLAPIAYIALDLDGGPKNREWLSKTLGISDQETSRICNLLLRLGYIRMAEGSGESELLEAHGEAAIQWVNVPPEFRLTLMKSFLGRLSASLGVNDQSLPQHGFVLAASPEQLPAVRAIFEEAMLKAMALTKGARKKTHLYGAQISLFELAGPSLHGDSDQAPKSRQKKTPPRC